MSKERRSESTSYDVGYRKPPRQTQFQKGMSGNPKGRPKGAKSVGTILAEMGRKRIRITTNGKTQEVTMLEAMIMQLVSRAAGGDMKAIRETLAAHRLFVEPEQEPETVSGRHERDDAVLKNLVKRMGAFSAPEAPKEND